MGGAEVGSLALQETPLGLANTEEGEGEMFAEIDQMINVNQGPPSDLEEAYSDTNEEADTPGAA